MCIVGMFKKLETSGKKKKCKQVADLADLARSVSNHQYCCAASSDGDGEMVTEKWLTILNHINNVHDCHGERLPSFYIALYMYIMSIPCDKTFPWVPLFFTLRP